MERQLEALERDLDAARRQAEQDLERQRKSGRDAVEEIDAKWEKEMDHARREWRQRENEWSTQRERLGKGHDEDLARQETEKSLLRAQVSQLELALDNERRSMEQLRSRLVHEQDAREALESAQCSQRAKIDFLESNSQAQSHAFTDMQRRMDEALEQAAECEEKLRKEEAVRRKLHNLVQELKGNIRVFCRVRPALENHGVEDSAAKLGFPDVEAEGKELTVLGPETKSALGNVTASTHAFSFDKVFGPVASNSDVFDEIAQLVQSALDGYNVCIFCYGQTGSGKTFTMSSPGDGMIPRAVAQIWEEKERLASKGWTYELTGQFVEVYNETLNDLLGNPEDLDKKKLEIRHDAARSRTTVENANEEPLDSPDRVHEMLASAVKNRSVAATKSNERSSRSHSVFMLRLKGVNSQTGERCEGVLNLVDLAGSERVKNSGVEGARLKETQNINRSLSCLGDVIAALGSQGSGKDGKEAFIPYRNSKLTYLLQYSLGGNSKTLMFVMVSPMQDHLGETLTSLKFATKVHNTHIGTARKQSKIKD
ncbi:kinesin [Eremomyces bilateralis CBS 781.70]|uniref:Kinesin-like protein n=1 Tax=Eremomyces bilateralis CBS 781.70 TaxID=1392243 RepID=A0A6G1FS95_9PEZI|nr:kinesin [Eremomyces bilateralis CBS 781.70]KAF1808606.1 kinesin [Eremomyces bilateralis CBS 781.70]